MTLLPRLGFLAVSCLILIGAGGAWGQEEAEGVNAAEYAIKAAFIRHFFQFVKWPEEKADAPYHVCVLGEDPFDDLWRRSLPGEADDRTLQVRRLRAPKEGSACRLLFVARSEAGRLPAILRELPGAGNGLLTVGDTPGFAQAGGVINFFTRQDRVHFEINTAAARRAGLTLSSKLLGLARLVDEGAAP